MQLRVEHDRVSVVWNIVKPYNNGERNGQRNYEISLRNIHRVYLPVRSIWRWSNALQTVIKRGWNAEWSLRWTSSRASFSRTFYFRFIRACRLISPTGYLSWSSILRIGACVVKRFCISWIGYRVKRMLELLKEFERIWKNLKEFVERLGRIDIRNIG